jgi:two-component system sensor histidine kinase KdpD
MGFNQPATVPVVVGGSLIVTGGMISSFWRSKPRRAQSSSRDFSANAPCLPLIVGRAQFRALRASSNEFLEFCGAGKLSMGKAKQSKFPRFIISAVPGCLMVGFITSACLGLNLNLTITGFLYLIAVVLQSLIGNSASSAMVSVVAVACLDFFFTQPVFSFEVTNPLDILALISFLVTGLVITRLTTRVGKEVAISEHQRRQFSRLYDLAQQLLALEPDDSILDKSVARFRHVFQLEAVSLFDVVAKSRHSSGSPKTLLDERTQSACHWEQDVDDSASQIQVRCLRATGKMIGAVGFEGLQDGELTIGPLAALAAAILERVQAFRSASHAAAAAEAEVFRSAILDALAHEFKTPLATILTAAGGLREIGSRGSGEVELAEIIETEAARLGDLTSRVLGTSGPGREQIKPRLHRIDIADLVVNLVGQYSRQFADRTFHVATSLSPTEVFADGDLLRLALGQLLDNACKYSPPGSEVNVSLELKNQEAAVRVLNGGNLIRGNERTRIFERFYRGQEAWRLAPGSGLGLYFAHKIAEAHGGSMALEEEGKLTREGTAFRLTLPLANSAA